MLYVAAELALGFNPNFNPGVNLFLVILTALVIHSWAWVVGGVYKNGGLRFWSLPLF